MRHHHYLMIGSLILWTPAIAFYLAAGNALWRQDWIVAAIQFVIGWGFGHVASEVWAASRGLRPWA